MMACDFIQLSSEATTIWKKSAPSTRAAAASAVVYASLLMVSVNPSTVSPGFTLHSFKWSRNRGTSSAPAAAAVGTRSALGDASGTAFSGCCGRILRPMLSAALLRSTSSLAFA